MKDSQTTNKTDLIKFTVPTQLKEDAVKLAKNRHISLSAMMRLMLTEYIKNKS